MIIVKCLLDWISFRAWFYKALHSKTKACLCVLNLPLHRLTDTCESDMLMMVCEWTQQGLFSERCQLIFTIVHVHSHLCSLVSPHSGWVPGEFFVYSSHTHTVTSFGSHWFMVNKDSHSLQGNLLMYKRKMRSIGFFQKKNTSQQCLRKREQKKSSP